MLGSDLELTADVVSDKLLEEPIVAVGKQIVKSDSRAHEHLFYLRKRLDSLKELYVFGVICDKILARSGREALASRADSVAKLLFAGRVAEISRRAANVVDIALEIRHFCYLLCFFNYALNAS